MKKAFSRTRCKISGLFAHTQAFLHLFSIFTHFFDLYQMGYIHNAAPMKKITGAALIVMDIGLEFRTCCHECLASLIALILHKVLDEA